MFKNYRTVLLVVLGAVFFTSCDKDDPEIPNGEELITTVTYTMTPSGGGTDVVMSFRDLDGDGGDEPVIVGGTLAANTTYNGTLELLNEANDPTIDIAEEVSEEDIDHQFFFQTDITDLTVSYSDQDSQGNPLGISSTVVTGGTGSGQITIILRHEPNKSAAGVSDGMIDNAGGETDIEISFPVDVN